MQKKTDYHPEVVLFAGKKAVKRKLLSATAEESFSGEGPSGVIPKKKPRKGRNKKHDGEQV